MEFRLQGRIKALQIKPDDGQLVAVVQIEALDVTPVDIHQLARAQQFGGLTVTFESVQREFSTAANLQGELSFTYPETAPEIETASEAAPRESEGQPDPLTCDLERVWEDAEPETGDHLVGELPEAMELLSDEVDLVATEQGHRDGVARRRNKELTPIGA